MREHLSTVDSAIEEQFAALGSRAGLELSISEDFMASRALLPPPSSKIVYPSRLGPGPTVRLIELDPSRGAAALASGYATIIERHMAAISIGMLNKVPGDRYGSAETRWMELARDTETGFRRMAAEP